MGWAGAWLMVGSLGAGMGDLVGMSAQLAAPSSAGGAWVVAVRLTVEPGWHIYWRNPGDSGMKTSVTLDLPAGVTAQPVEYAYPTRFEAGGALALGYAQEGWLFVPLVVQGAPKEKVRVSARWLACNEDRCVPGKAQQDVAWSVGPTEVHARRAALVPQVVHGAWQGTQEVHVVLPGRGTLAFLPDLPAGWRVVDVGWTSAMGTTARVVLQRPNAQEKGFAGVLVVDQTGGAHHWDVRVP